MTDRTLLDDDEVAAVLDRLPGWQGGREALTRTVTLPPERADDVLHRVREAEDALDHHAVVESDGDRVTFRVWTHSAGGVTALDAELAGRISAALTAGD